MENQGKSNGQTKASYIGVFAGLVGLFVMLIYLILS